MTNYTLSASKGTYSLQYQNIILLHNLIRRIVLAARSNKYQYRSHANHPGGTNLYVATQAELDAFQRWSENNTNGLKVIYRRYNVPTVDYT